MGLSSILYVANTTPQDVEINGAINFGNIVRRYGKNINLSGGNIQTSGQGYYITDVSVDFIGAAGTTLFTAYENGVAIPGARIAVTTTAGTAYEIHLPTFVTRNTCCIDKTISIVVSGAEASDLTASATIIKA